MAFLMNLNNHDETLFILLKKEDELEKLWNTMTLHVMRAIIVNKQCRNQGQVQYNQALVIYYSRFNNSNNRKDAPTDE